MTRKRLRVNAGNKQAVSQSSNPSLSERFSTVFRISQTLENVDISNIYDIFVP
jgi:hypothetical protein